MLALIALCGMTQLLVRNIPDSLAKQLKRRAVEHGVSAEEEHRRILHEALAQPAAKNKQAYTMFDHFRKLGEIAPDFEFERKRTRGKRSPVKF